MMPFGRFPQLGKLRPQQVSELAVPIPHASNLRALSSFLGLGAEDPSVARNYGPDSDIREED